MKPINDNELFKAIDAYSLLTNTQKTILKAMIHISVNDEVVATVTDLQNMTKFTRASISAAVSFFDKQGIIELSEIRGIKFTGCKLKQNKLQEIIAHYERKQQDFRK